MALPRDFSVYDETGTNRLYYNNEYLYPVMTTVYSFLTANVPGVRYVSNTIGGTPYSDDTTMRAIYNGGVYTVYAVPFPKTIAGQIERLQYDKAAICTAIENKGVTVGNVTLDNYAACIDAIPTGSNVAVVDILMIGGGGGGGRSGQNGYYGGGGGAGGVVFLRKRALESGSYPITIGAGGTQNVSGRSTCFDGDVALGGGAGGSTGAGCSGGNGGGAVATGTPGSGLHKGGTGCVCSGNNWRWGGGGGGACGDGGNSCYASNYMWGGVGGLGLCTCITGHYECFAGGGGGRGYCGGQGCYGGGNSTGMGAGGSGSTCGSGGGGAPDGTSSRCKAGNGAGGLLIISYPSDCGYNISGANCSCVCNGVCVHCFTSSGTLTVS